ncbi:SDR family NAD(P)-dependent oxidoreductase [Blastococcus sp. BMG 814]|uniref:SDR family NAD(P)-dependent oxidoreductase n=1 Tax=Blastococcus carthaginiensis TaxID=3050034 RepID=A0ABT9IAD3_9ACTN|nr:SDR family NAD(P)-dependent oxidoreductase [Blastococcus carthaginiensis]MDP5182535.1 SDR family NAD(P)-dependent oxidoreductase [Blastococcus carthaginiensis]
MESGSPLRPGSGAVLVTGGTSGIGLAVATNLVTQGRPVVVLGRDTGRAQAARSALTTGAGGAGVLAAAVDTTDPDGLSAVVAEAESMWGAVDGLVTAAGRLARGTLVDLPLQEFRSAWETNVLGTWLALRAVAPGMVARGYGRIVTVGSVLGSTGAPARGGYAATKGAVAALTRSIALELASSGVTVNCVAPGPVGTPMNEGDAAGDDAAQKAFTAAIPVGRWGTPAEVAHAIVPLLAAESGYTTGSVVMVDGGYTAR